MSGKVRVVKAVTTPAAIFSHHGSMKFVASPGTPPPPPTANVTVREMPVEPGTAPTGVDADAETRRWEDEVRRREASNGIAGTAVSRPLVATNDQDAKPTLIPRDPYPGRLPTVQPPDEPVDLGGLPTRFDLSVEQKADGWWIVRAPSVHPGLFVSRQDLQDALAEAPVALAQIVRLDGVAPAVKRRRRGGDA